MADFTIERQVDEFVTDELKRLGLKEDNQEFGYESNMSPYLKSALMGGSKTEKASSFGIPDFNITKYQVPVLIENKLNPKRLIKENSKEAISTRKNDIENYAVNGALHYARTAIRSGKYDSCVIVGIAGNNSEQIHQQVYYVYASAGEPKRMAAYDNLHFLATRKAFSEFLKDAELTDKEKHQILIKSQQDLIKQAKKLNKLMEALQISTEQRVVYVSGMLLAMQPIIDSLSGEFEGPGLIPSDLKGRLANRDSQIIMNQLSAFLKARHNVSNDKIKMMMGQFQSSINSDVDRDKPREIEKVVAKNIKEPLASINKQIFVFLYFNIYKQIDATSGSLDIMGSMYSEFLKYALSDGKSLGKVLTPPYITNFMAKALRVNMNDKVMDLATGSGAFLVSSMRIMIDEANSTYGIGSEKAKKKINEIKSKQLLGIEVDEKMYTLAASNMILRGDGSSQIEKHDSFKEPSELYAKFNASKLLLNPPFSFKEKGMPFIAFGLKHMRTNGLGAIIVQDSAGSGEAKETNQEILKHNTLLASIKMPPDLFNPTAGVQTSIYIFRAGVPHDFDNSVKFIDFRNDGYKRMTRGIYEVDHPVDRYNDLLLILKSGKAAENNPKFHSKLWDLNKQYIEDRINKSGADWNFEQHMYIDPKPSQNDFLKTVGEYMNFEVNSQIRKGMSEND